jgi:hypothetical protein
VIKSRNRIVQPRKLGIRRETIAVLTPAQLGDVVGGTHNNSHFSSCCGNSSLKVND